MTAYHHACANGHAECARLLVKAGCATALASDLGATGWAMAAIAPHVQVRTCAHLH